MPKKSKSKKISQQPAPLDARQTERLVKDRKASKPIPEQTLEFALHLPGAASASVRTGAENMLNIVARGVRIGEYQFPPAIETRRLTANRALLHEADHASVLAGYLPDHLGRRMQPRQPPRAQRVPPRIDSLGRLKKGYVWATTVFQPDERYIFQDTAFPWCTTGRVDTPLGIASGVMIGPRHLLTVSHTIQWNANNTAGWVKFTPSYFDGAAPFGEAWGTLVYYEVKVNGPTLDEDEQRHDYVVVVLDRRMGDTTGWMGSRAYSDDWDDEAYWRHIGYPADLSSANRPSYQRDIAFTGTAGPDEHHRINHKGDVWPGQSGGPYFAWWDNEDWPRVVGVQSGQETSTNTASGGTHMVDLIIRARNENP